MAEAVAVARDAGLLSPRDGGYSLPDARPDVDVALTPPVSTRPLRLLVLLSGPGDVHASIGDDVLAPGAAPTETVRVFELGARPAASLRVRLASPAGVLAAWIVARADELPPPPPRPW
jgi:hypothetical protein